MRNPNHYGSVSKLSGKRSRPWVVRVTMYNANGDPYQKAIGYTETREKALMLLAEYNQNPWEINREKITYNEVYQKWFEVKTADLTKSNRNRLRSAYKWTQPVYGMKYRSIKSYHMQRCIDECPRGYQTKSSIQTLFGHLDRFAFEMDIISKMYSQVITVHDSVPETKRKPFTPEQIKRLWDLSENWEVQVVLVYLYTGFRIQELLDIQKDKVDTNQWTLTGGEKTAAGKNRVVPIHTRIQPFITTLLDTPSEYLLCDTDYSQFTQRRFYNRIWYPAMEKAGIEGKTVHETRHTFETMLDNANANRRCIDLLMGHTSKDVGNRVYNHKTLSQLRETIELLH